MRRFVEKVKRRCRAVLNQRRGTLSIEVAILFFPFIYVLLVILQMGIYYMTQSALDAGVNSTANGLRNSFNTGTEPVLPSGSSLKSSIASNAAGLAGGSNLVVDLRLLTNLDAGAVAISDGTVDNITTNVPIVLRASANVVTLAPGFGALTKVESSAVLRFNAF
jgi:Flp pilus assembly protein TadG